MAMPLLFTIYAKPIVLHPLDSTAQLRLRDILQEKWSKACPTTAHIFCDGIFKVCFASEVARNLVLQHQPWFIGNDLLAVTSGDVDFYLAERDLGLTPFWIRIDTLPPGWDCVNGFVELIPKLREVFRHTPIFDYHTMYRGFIRFKAIINTSLPLPIGIDIPEEGRPTLWAVFEYEKLRDFCYSCGRLGHRDYRCPDESEEVIEEDVLRKYGKHLKTGSMVPVPDLFINGPRLSWAQRVLMESASTSSIQ